MLCSICNHRRLNPEGKKHYALKRTPIKKKFRNTGQADLFKIIWEEREDHICVNCEGYLGEEMKAHFFSHDISGKGKDVVLNKELISLRCNPCHREKDQGTRARYESRKGINKGKYVGNDL